MATQIIIGVVGGGRLSAGARRRFADVIGSAGESPDRCRQIVNGRGDRLGRSGGIARARRHGIDVPLLLVDRAHRIVGAMFQRGSRFEQLRHQQGHGPFQRFGYHATVAPQFFLMSPFLRRDLIGAGGQRLPGRFSLHQRLAGLFGGGARFTFRIARQLDLLAQGPMRRHQTPCQPARHGQECQDDDGDGGHDLAQRLRPRR